MIRCICAAVFAVAILGCQGEQVATESCGAFEEQFSQAEFDEETWQERPREYAETHPADEEIPVVVKPYSGTIENELEALGARAFYRFTSSPALLFIIQTGKLPDIINIQGISYASLGALGGFAVCT